MSPKIAGYALVGDMHSAALISKRGSLAWLCWPEFDSEACFASLLGTEANGVWSLSPSRIHGVIRRYLPGTLIVETIYTRSDGASVSVTDFMTFTGGTSCVVRIVRGLKRCLLMRTHFAPRFDYGNVQPRIEPQSRGLWSVVSGPHRLMLRTSAPLVLDRRDLTARWSVRAGETHYFTLQYGRSYSERQPRKIDAEASQKTTARFWLRWVGKNRYQGEYRKEVERSLITLKALTYAPSGGFVAAPTTSLPEKVGGIRNWDYRFCWLRDTTFSLQGLTACGFREDARAWLGWLSRALQGKPSDLKIMFGIAGKREHSEWVADWLPGYQGSKPVHIGNKASSQLQLDTYGEVLDTLYRARCHGLYPHADITGAALELPLLRHLEKIWFEPDKGLWEFRGGRQQFIQSKVMAWVAFDRGIRIAEEFGMKAPVERWRKIRERIHNEVCERGFHKNIQSFTQAYGTRHLDASLLLLPIVGFLGVDDERIAGTVRAIEKRLMHKGLLRRYDTKLVRDGLPPGEGAFLTCNFWLIDVYMLQGRLKEAKTHFRKLLALRNSLGLLSEEYSAEDGLIGNFPQAFSHVGLINAALTLNAGTSVRLLQLTKGSKLTESSR